MSKKQRLRLHLQGYSDCSSSSRSIGSDDRNRAAEASRGARGFARRAGMWAPDPGPSAKNGLTSPSDTVLSDCDKAALAATDSTSMPTVHTITIVFVLSLSGLIAMMTIVGDASQIFV